MHGYPRLWAVIHSYRGLYMYMVMHGYPRLWAVIHSYRGLYMYMVMGDYPWLWVVIHGYTRSWVVAYSTEVSYTVSTSSSSRYCPSKERE